MTVIYPPKFHARTTTASRHDNFARKVIERVHMKQRPAYVTATKHLGRVIADLECARWRVDTPPDGNITCVIHLPDITIAADLVRAQEWQRVFDTRKQN